MRISVLVMLCVSAPPAVQAQCSIGQCKEFSPTASRLAELIGVNPLLEQLKALPAGSPDAVPVRQAILEAVISTNLQADTALADIQNEQAQVGEVHSYLQAKRDRMVSVANLATTLLGVGGVIGTALQFSTKTEDLGNGIGAASGAASVTLLLTAARRQRRGASQMSVNSSMLAPFFEPRLGPESYPELVWCYLTMPLADTDPPVSWRDQLLREWVRTGRLETKDPRKAADEIKFLKSTVPAQRRVSIGYLDNRMAMLGEVRARVALMKRDLAELMCRLRAAPR